jgi:hypothetical protein
MRKLLRRTVRRMQAALEVAGVVFLNAGLMFIEENAVTSTKVRDAAARLGNPDHSLPLMKSQLSDSSARSSGRQIAAARILKNMRSVRSALEAAGVVFVEENRRGPGVRLKKGS